MKKAKNLAPGIAIVMVLMLATAAALLATPVLADPPQKYVASLEDDTGTRYGQVIFNTNLEDDGCYELEVEVEECMALAGSTVTVSLNPTGTEVGTIDVDESGNGKETFCVEYANNNMVETNGPIVPTVTVVGDVTLTGDYWRLWVQGKKGPK